MNRVTRATLMLSTLLAAWPVQAEPQANPAPAASPAEQKPAGGIRTDFGDVSIENLGIGRTYNLRDLAGTPLKVTNTGPDTINLLMTSEIPSKDVITPHRRELGFEPVPSPDWVSLSQSQFVVPSGESAYTDVIIKIPDDPKLYGKKFQASIYSRTTGGDGFIHVGVWSHLQLSIAQSQEVQAEIEKNRKRGTMGNLDYTLLPDKLVISNAVKGRAVNIRGELKKTIMIANSGSEPIKLRVKIVPLGDTPLSLQTGFEAGNPAWISVAAQEVTVEGASFTDPGLVMNLPNDPSLAGKQLMFAMKVEPADPNMVGVTFYGKLYVEVAK